jgi:hypothetical protein
MKKFILFFFLLNYSLSLSANEINCEKFDIKCKTKAYIKYTVEFQKKSFNDAKNKVKANKKK